MIPGIAQFQQIIWAVNTIMSVMLLVLLAVRKNYRAYPAFTFYIAMNLTQAALLFVVYRRWGYSSLASWGVAWGSQAATISARAMAVAELCRHCLSRYPGIWALAKRILLLCAGLVLLYSGVAARHRWELALPSAERGLELSIATVIVVLFLFARYYGVRIESADRLLSTGFCLYSCFRALNDTIEDRVLYGYSELWSLLGMLAFFASLSLWSWALRKQVTVASAKESLLPLGVYQSLTPEINVRLRGLNEQLCRLWKPEVTRH